MDEWIYWCAGMQIQHTVRDRATNGAVGITRSGQLVLFNNQGQEMNRGWVATMTCKTGTFGWTTSWVELNGTRYNLAFHPVSQNIGLAVGGLIGGAIAAAANKGPDPRSEKQKWTEFWNVVNYIRSGQPPAA